MTVRFVPDPPSTILAAGIRVVFEDAFVTVSDVAAVSTSPIIKAMGDVEVFLLIV